MTPKRRMFYKFKPFIQCYNVAMWRYMEHCLKMHLTRYVLCFVKILKGTNIKCLA